MQLNGLTKRSDPDPLTSLGKDSDPGEKKVLRVLIVEDSEDDASLLIRELRNAGYDLIFERVETADAVRAALAGKPWDVVVSDYSMPHFSGLGTLELVNKAGIDVPVFIVSGTIGEETAVAAMKAGATDYLMKGNLKRLVPALARELREAQIRRERAKAKEESERNSRRIRALHEVDLAIVSTLDLQTVLSIVMDKIDLAIPDSATTIRLINKKTGELQPVACRNVNESEWKARITQVGGLGELVLRNKTPLTVSNIQTDPRNKAPEFARSEGLISFLGVPLIAKNECLGLMAYYTREMHRFSDDEIEYLMTLAGQAAVGIYNAHLYDDLKTHATELERANKVKSEFLSVMSHEFRTPINIIMGYASAVQEGLLGQVQPAQCEALGKVLSRSKELLNLTNSIFQATQIETDTMRVEVAPVDLNMMLDHLQSKLQFLLTDSITLKWDYPRNLPTLLTDGAKLSQILENLVMNAIKFTKQGAISVSVSHDRPADRIEVKVRDTGIGIAPDLHQALFEKFRQADSSVRRSYEGVGLGLFIVKQFTELIGGTVGFETEVGKGSTFTVSIPLEAPNRNAQIAGWTSGQA